MRVSLLKALGVSIVALALGGALVATPASAKGGFGGGGGIYYHGGGGPSFGGAPSFHGAPSFGGAGPHGNPLPSGGFAPGAGVPHGGFAHPGGAMFHHRYTPGHRYPRGWGGIVIAPEMCDDYYCDYEYNYEDTECWVYRRVYDRHGKFVGWRQVYICEGGQ